MERLPIYSILEEDPELREPISAFVVGLAERVDILQDVFSSGDFPRLGQLCRETSGRANQLGYPTLAEVADAIGEACDEQKSEAAERGLLLLSQLSQRVRQAHRGAA